MAGPGVLRWRAGSARWSVGGQRLQRGQLVVGRHFRLGPVSAQPLQQRLTIAQQYLDGVIDRPTAVTLTQKYMLVSPKRAEQSVSFTDQYRSYVINYGLGEAMVRAHVERGKPSRDEMWRRMAKLVSEPTLPADLLAR